MLRGRVTLTPSEISNYGVKQGDIFVTRTSETIEEIGYASVMLDSPKDTVSVVLCYEVGQSKKIH